MKVNNKDLVLLVFKRIKEMGFTICNVTHPNGYFIWEGEDDSVTHFHLKGHGIWRKWKFGLWVDSKLMSDEELNKVNKDHESGKWGDEPKVIQLFAQHESNIDKFKPSRSSLCVSYDAQHIIDTMNGKYVCPWALLESMLKMMCRHPFLCYEEFCGNYVGYSDEFFLWEYIKNEAKIKYKKAKKLIYKSWWYPYTVVKCYFAKKDPCIYSLKIHDFEKEMPGWSTNYLYRVNVKFTEDATEDMECNWLNKWFRRNEYGKYSSFNCIVELDSLTKEGRSGYYTYG